MNRIRVQRSREYKSTFNKAVEDKQLALITENKLKEAIFLEQI
jgi:hypothetical protein